MRFLHPGKSIYGTGLLVNGGQSGWVDERIPQKIRVRNAGRGSTLSLELLFFFSLLNNNK